MSISLENVTKRYGGGQVVVEHVSLEVETGELFVLLGASGSGKSTILRMIAGLSLPDEGTIRLAGRDVTGLPPQKRDVGFVFQNYSIFRHMTVGENIEFGLRIRGVPAAEREQRRDELLDLVGLGGLAGRYENQLSGGQRQRVALARGLAYKPTVLLLDEPFGALDVKIRGQLRQNLKEIQKTLGVTTILVTHDQEESFELGQRIGVIDRGRLLEVAAPERLYTRPQSLFVATFLGAGTVLVGSCREHRVELGSLTLPIPDDVPHDEGDRVRVLIRPEQVTLSATQPPSGKAVLGRAELVEQSFSGATKRARVRLPLLKGVRQVVPPLPFGEESVLLDVAVPAHGNPTPPQPWVALEGWHILRQPTPRLLVCDEGSGSTPALELARPLVEALDGIATVLGVATDSRRQDELREALTKRAAEAGLEEVTIRTRRGDPAEQIALEQREAPYDFVIVGARELETRPGRRRPPSPAEELLGRVATPLLLARGRPRRPERILICTAVGEPGKADVRAGGWLARRLGATVTLLHVTPRGRAPLPFVRAHLERGVATLRELGVSSGSSVREAESPIAGIVAELRQQPYDVVVVGAPPRSSRIFLRPEHVTRQVLRQVGCSILVVPEGSW
ncbi:MAG TPA: ATP-binding cassette domain-containing protein [Thermoanaerobaculia bacterium]|jgi:sulfate transport system ATP-binding protein